MARSATKQLLRVVETSTYVFRQERTADGHGTRSRIDGTKYATVIIWVDPEHPAFIGFARRAMRTKSGRASTMSGAITAIVQRATLTNEGKEE